MMRTDKQNDAPQDLISLETKLRRSVSGTSFTAPITVFLVNEIFSLAAGGLTNREIAHQLNLDPGTVATYRKKLFVHSFAEQHTSQNNNGKSIDSTFGMDQVRPPFDAEYVLYLLLRKEERDVVIGDLIEEYGRVRERFNKRRADIWFYKQVAGSLFPLLRRALLRIGALVWLGRVLRRLIS